MLSNCEGFFLHTNADLFLMQEKTVLVIDSSVQCNMTESDKRPQKKIEKH